MSKPQTITPGEQVEQGFDHIAKVLEPLTKGDGEDEAVEAARLAMSCLYILRQYARKGTP